MAITIPPVSELPIPPTKADPNNFAARADDFLGALPEFQVELNATVTQMNKLVTGLDQGSPIAAWLVGTTYSFPTVVAGSDGYSYRCIGTGIVGEDPVAGGTNWVRIAEPPLGNPSANGMALTSTTAGTRSWQYAGLGEIPAGITLTGGVVGFDISKTAANQVTVSPGIAMDSSGTTPLAMTSATAISILATASTIYHLFVVRLTPSGIITVKAYITEAAAAVDASVDRFRWIGFWRTNVSSECVVAIMVDGYMSFGKGSENIVATVNTTWGTKTTSSFVPDSRVGMIAFGARYAAGSDVIVISSLDGTNAEPYITATSTAAGVDTEYISWVGNAHPGMMLFPHTTSRQFKTVAGTASLLIFAVRVRR